MTTASLPEVREMAMKTLNFMDKVVRTNNSNAG